MDPRKLWALVLGGCVLAVQGVLLALGWGPFNPEGAPLLYFLMILIGGPACLLVGLPMGMRWTKVAGALLWVGGALEAIGIALRSGPMVGRYFLGLALFVVPQVLAGSLLLVLARDAEKRSPRR